MSGTNSENPTILAKFFDSDNIGNNRLQRVHGERSGRLATAFNFFDRATGALISGAATKARRQRRIVSEAPRGAHFALGRPHFVCVMAQGALRHGSIFTPVADFALRDTFAPGRRDGSIFMFAIKTGRHWARESVSYWAVHRRGSRSLIVVLVDFVPAVANGT